MAHRMGRKYGWIPFEPQQLQSSAGATDFRHVAVRTFRFPFSRHLRCHACSPRCQTVVQLRAPAHGTSLRRSFVSGGTRSAAKQERNSLLSVISDCVLNVAGGRRPSSAVTIRWGMSGKTAPLADAMPLCTMWSSTRGMTVACLSTGESNSNRWHHRRRRIPQQRDTGGCELFLLVHRGGAFATVPTAMAHTSPCWSFWGIF